MRRLFLLASVVMALVAAGCATVAHSMAKGIAKRTVERELLLPSVPSGEDLARFARCFETRGGACPTASVAALQAAHPVRLTTRLPARETRAETPSLSAATANIARDVLNHPVQEQLLDLYNLLQGVPKSQLSPGLRSPTPVLEINIKELDDFLQSVELTTALGGWDALAMDLRSEPDDAARRRVEYIAAYVRAYFRDGSFFQFSLTTQGLVDRLKEQLKRSLPLLDDGQIEALVRKLLKEYLDLEEQNGQYPDKPIFGKLGTGGFVTRGGKGYQFPSIEAKLDPTSPRKLTVSQVDFVATGGDVVRVVLHAIFDAEQGLSAVTNATGVTLSVDPLSVNTAGEPGHLSAEHFGEVEVFADRLEGVTGAAVGRVIRGISWLSLNNEALATAIETIVAVTARKFAEKAAWCWFSCGLDASGKPTLADAAPLRVRLRVTGAERLVEP